MSTFIKIYQLGGGLLAGYKPPSISGSTIVRDGTKVTSRPMSSAAEAKKQLDAKVQARKQAVADSNRVINTEGESALSRAGLASSSLENRARLFPNEADNVVDEYLNPGVWLGRAFDTSARSLALHGPNSREFNSSLIEPGATVALSAIGAGPGARGVYRTLNNMINPIAGMIPGRSKSSINWSKWNSEIPSNKPLMKEYSNIERSAKANGTWMKNADGSNFEGLPEQFVQQRSENFKRAFPEGFDRTYRGDRYATRTHRNIEEDKAVFGAKNEDVASHYIDDSRQYHHPHNIDNSEYAALSPGMTELATRRSPDDLIVDAKGKGWRFLDDHPMLNRMAVKMHREDITNLIEPGVNDHFQNNLKKWFDPNKPQASTDLYASAIMNNPNTPSKVIVKNVIDGLGKPTDVSIINPFRNQIKSLRYNNGVFDMNNPDIYKTLAPIGLGASLYNRNKNNGGD